MNDKKISQKMKNKDWLSIEKDIMKCKKITNKDRQMFSNTKNGTTYSKTHLKEAFNFFVQSQEIGFLGKYEQL